MLSMLNQAAAGLKWALKTFALGIPIGVTLIDVFGYVARVDGHSMQPLLNPDNSRRNTDYVFLYNWPIITNSFDKIERGEIIALVSPRDPKQRLIKRVVGLGGDIIETKGYYKKQIEIPAGHCWVEGDNHGHSLDSNIFGPVALGLVKSKATCIVWPPKRISFLKKEVESDRVPLNLHTARVKDISLDKKVNLSNKMITLSLVDCLELKFTGSILKEALCFGDVDNDGASELVVGNSDGELFIFKDDKCICRAFDLGCIAAIAVGDLLNISKNMTVVITTEGYCHVFDVEDELRAPLSECIIKQTSNSSSTGSVTSTENFQTADSRVIQQFHSQRIVANTKAIFLADVNDDGLIELICGLTDRVLRTYKWNPDPVIESEAKDVNISHTVFDGRVEAVNKWELTNQIGSIAPHTEGNLVSIIIGTGGGTVTRITEISDTTRFLSAEHVHTQFGKTADEIVGSVGCRLERNDSVEKDLPPGTDPAVLNASASYSENISIRRHALNSSKMRNPNISTHVAGNIASQDGSHSDSYAVGTWDGTVMICKDDTIEWNLQLNKPVMTVQSFSGNAIFVDMEGPTYLINRRLDPQMQNCVIRFYFEDQVAAFRVGWYGIRGNSDEQGGNGIVNQKCFAYVTFQGTIYIYPNSYL